VNQDAPEAFNTALLHFLDDLDLGADGRGEGA
jgi:hypothetical protein